MTTTTYSEIELYEMAAEYIKDQYLPNIQKTIFAPDINFYSTFKKWGAIIDFWIFFDVKNKLIKESLTLKIYIPNSAIIEKKCISC